MIEKNDLISDEYADQNRLLHERQPWGQSGRKYAKLVDKFAREIGARDLLDYGCGRSTLREALEERGFPFPINEYDPAFPHLSALPPPADLVVCTDVMEHVEPKKIDNVLRHIHALSVKGCYMVIATRDTDHILPDGRSAHLTVEGPEWWIERVLRVTKWKHAETRIHRNEENNTFKKVTLWLTK